MAIGRPLSLTGNDFYPLVHICTKDMTYDQKTAYRAKHGVPNTIDKWIADGKIHTKEPIADPHRRGPSLEYLLWQDDVECILNIICKKVNIPSDLYQRCQTRISLFVRDSLKLTVRCPTNSH